MLEAGDCCMYNRQFLPVKGELKPISMSLLVRGISSDLAGSCDSNSSIRGSSLSALDLRICVLRCRPAWLPMMLDRPEGVGGETHMSEDSLILLMMFAR